MSANVTGKYKNLKDEASMVCLQRGMRTYGQNATGM